MSQSGSQWNASMSETPKLPPNMRLQRTGDRPSADMRAIAVRH